MSCMVASPCRASIRIASSHHGRGRRCTFDQRHAEGRMANCRLQPSLGQSLDLHPLPPSRPILSGSVSGRLRRDAHATHLFDLLRAQVRRMRTRAWFQGLKRSLSAYGPKRTSLVASPISAFRSAANWFAPAAQRSIKKINRIVRLMRTMSMYEPKTGEWKGYWP